MSAMTKTAHGHSIGTESTMIGLATERNVARNREEHARVLDAWPKL